MTTHTTVTTADLEAEHAELLPRRETLWVCRTSPAHSSSTTTVINGSGNGNNDGNGFLPIASGDLDGNLNGDVITIF
jgi:hypothetical protein